jgi:hypothetical protein
MADLLPHRNQDAVLTLYAHYFLAAVIMRENFDKLEAERKSRGRLSKRITVDQGIYFTTWLGFLGVTCEGFRKLNMRALLQNNRPPEFQELLVKSNGLGRVMNLHADELRQLRNSIFHLRDDTEAINKFFAEKAIRKVWAEELNSDFTSFFSDYRVLCEVHYVTTNRTSESHLHHGQRKSILRPGN